MCRLFAWCASLVTRLGRILIRAIMGIFSRRHRHLQHVLLVGSNVRACAFATRILTKPHLGYHLLGYIDDPHPGQTAAPLPHLLRRLGTLQEFDTVLDLAR